MRHKRTELYYVILKTYRPKLTHPPYGQRFYILPVLIHAGSEIGKFSVCCTFVVHLCYLEAFFAMASIIHVAYQMCGIYKLKFCLFVRNHFNISNPGPSQIIPESHQTLLTFLLCLHSTSSVI